MNSAASGICYKFQTLFRRYETMKMTRQTIRWSAMFTFCGSLISAVTNYEVIQRLLRTNYILMNISFEVGFGRLSSCINIHTIELQIGVRVQLFKLSARPCAYHISHQFCTNALLFNWSARWRSRGSGNATELKFESRTRTRSRIRTPI